VRVEVEGDSGTTGYTSNTDVSSNDNGYESNNVSMKTTTISEKVASSGDVGGQMKKPGGNQVCGEWLKLQGRKLKKN
jgi:hypothetical protein